MPAVALTVALPVVLPKQPTLDCAVTLLLSAATGCVMATLRVVEQPIASVMVQVHVPAVRLFAVAPDCTGTVFHKNE